VVAVKPSAAFSRQEQAQQLYEKFRNDGGW
jgi:hypothetical protein